MQSLYANGFEIIYDEMYQTFIDYKDAFTFYSALLKQHQKNQVLEIGCGSGNLAKLFIDNNYKYSGLDYSADMIHLCKSKNPKSNFVLVDMTNFSLKNKTESIIITGRTSSYLLSNKDISGCLKSVYQNLKSGGLLCFDFIDANRFFKEIKGGKEVMHAATFIEKEYERVSFFNTHTTENLMFTWDAKYYEITPNEKKLIA
jgi:SAM-dependent methyltransferase